jgi:hypothetical protein
MTLQITAPHATAAAIAKKTAATAAAMVPHKNTYMATITASATWLNQN